MRVVFYQDAIQIVNDDEIEMLYWNEEEWIEDPTIVYSIANAINLIRTDPKFLEETNKKHVDSIIAMYTCPVCGIFDNGDTTILDHGRCYQCQKDLVHT